MKKIIAVAIISTILVILSLYAVNAVIVSQQRDKQREVAHTLLHYSEGLSESVALALEMLRRKAVMKPALMAIERLNSIAPILLISVLLKTAKLPVLPFGENLPLPSPFRQNFIKRHEGSCWRSFRKKIFSPATQPFIIMLLFSPPVMPTTNLHRLRQTTP